MRNLFKLIVIFLFLLFFVKPVDAATLWHYQCIDTMKISRDKARGWTNTSDLDKHITWEMKTIKDMGANCVAIDTPYDEEFLPYMTKWASVARKYNLHVWFRGNFSGWEGWFDYPKNMKSSTLIQKTETFITKHPNLFADGDIFTPAPEAENGGDFNQVEPNAYGRYRIFLITEYQTATDAFRLIGKKVTVNWLSMNGGLARRMMDQKIIDSIDHLVTIDHYIKTPQEMTEYINYFTNNFHAKVVVGEFGAPIPDINGDMNAREQAAFVRSVFDELYKNKEHIEGVNYWDLYDGSTALINDDQTPREVVQVVKDYFTPAVVQGHVQNTLGESLGNIIVKINNKEETVTDTNGNYTATIVANKPIMLTITGKNYGTVFSRIGGKNRETMTQNAVLQPKEMDIRYRIKLIIKDLKKRIAGFFRK